MCEERRRVLQNNFGALLTQFTPFFLMLVGSTTHNWFGCFMFSLQRSISKSIKGRASCNLILFEKKYMNVFVETIVNKNWSRKVSSLTIYLFSEGT